MDLRTRVDQLDHRTDAVLNSFDTKFSSILSKTQVHTSLKLRAKLDLTPAGDVKATAANLRVIKALPSIFKQTLSSEGYDDLLTHFSNEFNGGLPTLDGILSDITNNYQIKPVTFTDADLSYFDQIKQGAVINLDDAVNQAANAARSNTLFSVGGRPFDKVAVSIAERLHVALGEANTMAATGISSFYRTIANRGFEKIEESLGGKRSLEYTYVGPPASDRFIRPFCQRLMTMASGGRTWNRGQIDKMNNGQLLDVFVTGGGYNCRHQWIVALER